MSLYMRRRNFLTTLFIFFFIMLQPAYGALDLELTRGIAAALPIAVLPFSGSKVMVSDDETFSDVIKNDLQNSGQFRVIKSGHLPQNQRNISQADYRHWRKLGVNNVVFGTIRKRGMNQYQVTYSLVNVFNSAAQNNGTNNTLLSETFKLNAKGLRNLAHHISDSIYQELTGTRGIFSTKIAYVLVQRAAKKPTKYTLEVADADGFNPQPLLISNEPIMSPTWSPDGKRLAYVSFENHRATIYIQDLATGQRELVSNAPGINGAPAFSPDGKRLALVLTKTGNPKIYVMELATKSLQNITHGWSIDTEPAWAPDGRTLLFTSNRDGSPQIYNYSFDNGKVNRLTYDGNYNARGSFMPDDKSIIMMHRGNRMFGIAFQNLKTGRVQILAQTGADESPSLAPNGKMVIYATQYGGRGVLAQVSTDGSIKLRLPSREGSVQEPAWSPFLNT